MLSIVATLYKSSPYVDRFVERAARTAREVAGDDYEIVLVNDGSPDDSLAKAVALSGQDRHVVVVDLSRNFGHHRAMMTGLAHASGDLIFLIDSDLEEQPEWLVPFREQLDRTGSDVVYGVQRSRKGGRAEQWTGALYYALMRSLSDVDIPANEVTARLMTRRYVDALLRHEERDFDIGGLWAMTGFEQQAQPIDKQSTSATTYTFRRRLALTINAITSFSSFPLIAIFYIGSAISCVAFFYLLFIMVTWILREHVSGWTSLIVSVWLLGGTIIAFIGVLGLYISKLFIEVKRRPYSIVRKVYGRD